jgi:long-chain acyl-CoA synthetase
MSEGTRSPIGEGPALFRFVESPDFASKPFIVLGDKQITYGDLHLSMRQLVGLFAAHGVMAGDRIVICVEHDMDVIPLYLGAMRCGVTPALIDPDSSIDEATALVKAARAKALFAGRRLLGAVSLQAELVAGGTIHEIDPSGTGGLNALLQGTMPRDLPRQVPDDASAFILFTSGTTSRPKGVEVSLGAVTAHMVTMHRQYGYDTSSVVINGLPLHHSDGINHGPVNIMAAGGTVYRTGTFTVQKLPAILSLVRQAKVTHLITVPTVLSLISRMGPEYTDAFRTPAFRFVSSTAGPLDEGLWRAFEERFGTMVVNGYGLTETVCEGFYCGPSDQTRRIGTVGKPIDIDTRIIDADGCEVSDGEMGELILRGSCVMKGYFDAPVETAEVLKDGWLHTGDLAIRDSDGFYTITGRKKNVIICGGANVYPEDVTRTLLRMPGVLDAVTVGIPDVTFGERVVSCVVLAPESGLGIDQVQAFCGAHLAREKVPSRVFQMAELPRGPSGKVALPQVKQIVADLMASDAGQALAGVAVSAQEVAQRVMQLAAAAFKCDVSALDLESEPETTDGWTSLAHMDFLVSLEATFGMTLSPSDMLDIVTLGDAIEHVQAAVHAKQGQGSVA